jgi:membrane protease YdiL (CAAX protease family)
MGDLLLGAVFIVSTVIAGSIVGLIVAGGEILDSIESGDTAALPIAFLGISLLFQQFGQGVWPFIVSKWKGLGPKSDWGFDFKWIDLGIGLGAAMIGLAAAGVAGLVASELVDLTDDASADNTQFLTDAEGTPWLYLILFLVVVGAPFSEELLFRGLTLRAIEKRLGSAAAVIGSSIIFTVPHWIGSDWRGTLVLFASIFAVGLVLAVTAVMTRRLGAPILAHMIFNSVGAAGALGWLDGLGV